MAESARTRAARYVSSVVFERRSLESIPDGRTRALTLGALRYGLRYRAILKRMLRKPEHAQDPLVMSLMMVGLYQLEHRRDPLHAVMHQTVEACHGMHRAKARGLVNAVLRRYLDEGLRAQLNDELAAHEKAALPAWLFKRLQRRWPQHCADIVKAFHTEPKLHLRVNRRQVQRRDYGEQLSAADIEYRDCEHCEHGLRLRRNRPVGKLPGYDRGLFSVQDQSAQLAAPLLEAQAGQRMLDACAAPGGKSAHILELTEPSTLVAMDVSDRRLQMLRDNMRRLRLDSPTLCVLEGDATQPEQWWDGEPFDRILLDVPCSATGVLRRHPDIAFLRRESDIKAFAERQQAMLDALWGCLRLNGRLLYVSCSLLAEENESPIEQFMARQSQAEAVPMDQLPWGEPCGVGRITLPDADGGDGLFFACLQRAI